MPDIKIASEKLLEAWDTCQELNFYMEQLRNSLKMESDMIVREGKNRLDLEQEILDCWNVTKDLDTLLSTFDKDYNEDEVINMIIGIKALYNRKFEVMFETFETCLNNKELT